VYLYRKTLTGVIDAACVTEKKPMTRCVLSFSRIAALLLFGLCFEVGFGAAPAVAGGCGYGCYAPALVVVQPYYYQSCSCCGCGTSGYGGYAYAYPSPYYGAYAAEYDGYDGYYAPRPRPRYWGPRRWW